MKKGEDGGISLYFHNYVQNVPKRQHSLLFRHFGIIGFKAFAVYCISWYIEQKRRETFVFIPNEQFFTDLNIIYLAVF